MTIRTFWTIFIKILGLWLVFDSVTVIFQFFSAIFTTNPAYPEDNNYATMAVFILAMGVYAFILWLFVFKTAWLINKLHLEKGFLGEENIGLDIHRSTVLKIAIIVIGGIMLVDSLPPLCKQTFVFYQQKNIFREDPQ